MESKHVYMALAVVLVAAAAFFGVRYFKGEDSTKAHQQDAFQRMTQSAQTIPQAGLEQMAKILQKYRAENNGYPPNLQMLYPKYVPYKDFIDQVPWEYEVSGGSFSLAKSITTGSRTYYASIDDAMKVQIGTGTAVAAARSAGGEPEEVDSGKAARLKRGLEMLARLKAPEFKPERPQGYGLGPLRTETRVVKETEQELPEFAGRASRAYLVWRNEDGQLGFGNVQYPRAERFDMAAEQRWYSVRHTGPGPESDAREGPDVPDKADDAFTDPLAEMSRAYLVWKDESGHLGVGNIDYPRRDELQIATPQQWRSIRVQEQLEQTSQPEENVGSPALEAGAAPTGAGSGYLAWRDREGNVGFGNVGYPDFRKLEAVYSGNRWDTIPEGTVKPPRGRSTTTEKPFINGESGTEGLLEAPPSLEVLEIRTREGKADGSRPLRRQSLRILNTAHEAQDVADRLTRSYLVWRSTEGHLGFGNIQYPQEDRFEMAAPNGWYTVRNFATGAPSGPQIDPQAAAKKLITAAPDSFTGMSRSYLVWKDDHGYIGVGNVAYPATRSDLQVATSQDWQFIRIQAPPDRISSQPDHAAPPRTLASDAVPVGAGSHYLAWRDSDGTIGFGNVDYPSLQELEAVYTEAGWEKVERR